MKNNIAQFEVKKMAKAFKVSRSGYYKSIDRKESKRKLYNNELLVKIKSIHKENREVYGSPEFTLNLKNKVHRAHVEK